ncbi:very-long-chain aldehyde decarbonylase CER1-like [Impatiens glandulifera]|uniref:very-long-chain aldehyde decarbonylase CER1-like n=1 Tax=Impatiens glandulifera TaxID=253017 RepID=UPI001FB052F9|nr:very-long-chain aldehyde decarbonylase CER1-like [Impatiens glandulifera]
MATKPGILTDWPWKNLGNFKYVILAPFVVHSFYSFFVTNKETRDMTNLLIFPFLLSRIIHNLIWISFSRHRTAKATNRILHRSIEFDQVDRESNWDDQILLTGIMFYLVHMMVHQASHLPLWNTNGLVLTIFLHMGPVEFLYYWLHRALHYHFLYSRYHSHHHSSIVTEPITSVIHPFIEEVSYFLLFAIPMMGTVLMGIGSITGLFGYITYIDFMNNMGHCNFEFIPKWLFSVLPPLKYLMYTPSFHSLHHTQFRTNYSLYMPIYDYIYGTMDPSSDSLQEKSLAGKEESPDVVHLTHLTTPESIYHLRLGFASLASMPLEGTRWYHWFLWPITCWSMLITCIYGHTFIVETNVLDKLKLHSWTIPRYNMQYYFQWQKQAINNLIEEAILEAEANGVKVMSLGLLNQGDELNNHGELYIRRNPKLNIKVVDGSSLMVAIVLNSIPKGTRQVLLIGKLNKVAYSLASILLQKGIQVALSYEDDYEKIKLRTKFSENLLFSRTYSQMVWLVGDGQNEKEQFKAKKGTLFIPFSQFPPKNLRDKDCFYRTTPSMTAPSTLKNVHSCENWLPRRVMSATRVTGIVHALEGWKKHECGDSMLDVKEVWEASLRHGFRPVS